MWNDDGEALFNNNWYAVLFGAETAWHKGESSIPRFQTMYGEVFHGDATGKISQLNDLRPYVERFDKNGQTYYRARFIGFGGERQATDMCGQLKKAKMSCLAMQS